MSYLSLLIGKVVKSVEFDLSSTTGINSTQENLDLIELYLQLSFDEYDLSIFNKFSLLGSKDVKSLSGKTIVSIDEKENWIDFIFSDYIQLRLDLSDEGYIGPEAMHLRGKNNLDVVWN